MNVLACTLLADGASDRVLKPLLDWLLDSYCPVPHQLNFADGLQGNPRGLSDRIVAALDQYPCDLLFVHRDAETVAHDVRFREVQQAWPIERGIVKLIIAIPVRMTEAWLLLDEQAIRTAAGNPNGQMALQIPVAARLESLVDPKEVLFEALRTASGLAPGRLRKFVPAARRHRVPELMSSFEPLRQLPSFQRLEAQMQRVFQI